MAAPTLELETFLNVVEQAPDGIVLVDGTGSIVYLNQRMQDLFGYPVDELIGQRIEVLVPQSRRGMHSLHREIFHERPETRPMGSGLSLIGERKDGTVFPVEVSLSSLTTSNGRLDLAVVRDVSRQRRAEDALRRSEERHRLLNERSDSIIFRYRLVPPALEYASSAATKLLGYTPEQLYVDPGFLSSLVLEQDRDDFSRMLRGETPPAELAVRMRPRDGGERWFDLRVTPVTNAEGLLVAVEGLLSDSTERRLLEEDRRSLLSQVATDLDRQRIAGDLHDDIVQSLYAVGLELEVSRDESTSSRDELITHTMRQLNGVIGELRHFMQELSGEEPAVPDLRTALQALVGDDERWTLAVNIDTLDEQLARALFLLAKELISNVRRHAEARTARVELNASRDDVAWVELTVRDDGRGFDPAQVDDRAFGLRSLQRRVAALNGRVHVESAEGLGTTVIVVVPGTSLTPLVKESPIQLA